MNISLVGYQTASEAAQAAWGYACGVQDGRGDSDLPRHAGAVTFGEAYGNLWQRYRDEQVAHRPCLADAWRSWTAAHNTGRALTLFRDGECSACGLTLRHGECLRRGCVTRRSLELFLAYAREAPNSPGGTPPISHDVGAAGQGRRDLNQLTNAGLITTAPHEGPVWITFTPAGHALAMQHGIRLGIQ